MATSKKALRFHIKNEHAAGIDVGSKLHAVSTGLQKDESKTFGVFTYELHQLCQWLVDQGVKSVAMESTGIYWCQLFAMIQSYGMEAVLVNASFTKNIQGRKPSDLADSQWIWKMHSVGLLPNSYQPDVFTENLRTYVRHRRRLIEGSSQCINRMQKSLISMNLQLPIVLSDISGKSGQAIIKAILAGERDGHKLAELADGRVKASKETIAKALTGFWRDSHLFTLQQHWDSYQHLQRQIAVCDQQVENALSKRISEIGNDDLAYQPVKKKAKSRANAPKFDLSTYAFQLTEGVDLMSIDGVNLGLILTLISEVGVDLSKFPTHKHFVSWLSLCPNKKVSGGKVLSSRSRKNKNRLSKAFKQAAVSFSRNKRSPLGSFYRRIAAKKGKQCAIMATARKLAIIVYHMMNRKQAFNPMDLEKYQQQFRSHRIKGIKKLIDNLDITQDELIKA
jgi:transposase